MFNPNTKKDGWQCGHTVVEIANDDMPFLVDSVTAELYHRDLTVHLIIHPVMAISRTAAGKLSGVVAETDTADVPAESVMHLQITEQTDSEHLKDLARSIENVLGDVCAAIEDWRPMLVRIADVITELDSTIPTAERSTLVGAFRTDGFYRPVFQVIRLAVDTIEIDPSYAHKTRVVGILDRVDHADVEQADLARIKPVFFRLFH